jgi:two-component system, NarL family, response regulator DevR
MSSEGYFLPWARKGLNSRAAVQQPGERPRFLVVDDEKIICAEVARRLVPYGDTVPAQGLREAHRALDTVDHWTGALIDINLAPGCGLDVVDRMRTEHPAVPVVVMTGGLEPKRINDICYRGLCFLAKPFTTADVVRFAQSAIEGAEERLKAALSAYSRRHGFCSAEENVLACGVECASHAEIAARRGCSVHTIQAHVTSMMKKRGARSFHEITLEVMREAAGLKESSKTTSR